MSGEHRVSSLFATHLRHLTFVLLCFALLAGGAFAQDSATVPNLVKYSGAIADAPAGTTGVIFALYKDQTGGAPLWQEVQTLTLDASGRYTTLLGSSSATGIPFDVFSSNEARWLGVQLQGQPEQPRVLLVSVPYALKAADAQTLGGLPASAFLRTDTASTTTTASAPTSAYVSTAVVTSAATTIAPAMTISGAMAGFMPVFTDTMGDMNSSVMAQANGNVGIGTANPLAMLHLMGTNPTMRIENYSDTLGDSPNFNFYTGRGTAAAPLATQNNDNLGQFASAGYNGTGFPSSRVKVTFLSTENWTPTANGTAMTFATTQNGTTSRHERMRIDNTGNIGIGTTTPGYPLSVNGTIQSLTGGFLFPDGTTQNTAELVGPVGPAGPAGPTGATGPQGPAASISLSLGSGLTGSYSSSLLSLSTDTGYLQHRVSGNCPSGSAVASINLDGTVNCQTVSGGGAIALPVSWSSITAPTDPPTVPQGVLNVTNAATGTTASQGPPDFNLLPMAILGKATGSQITAGVAGIATGAQGVGVFAETTTSASPTLVAWSGITGYTGNNDPSAIEADLQNGTGAVIKADSGATTGPAPCTGSGNCSNLNGVQVNMQATSGVTTAFSANLNSPASQGININFSTPPTSGSMINMGVNCSGSGSCPFFQVDGNANLTTDGTVNTNGLNVSGKITTDDNGTNFLANANFNNGFVANGNATIQNLYVSGNLSKAAGTFKIDDPLDPANKYLYHSFVESPDMMNIYNGVIVLDKHGKAVVQMPDYFQALNQDFRYQLTAMGAPGPNLYIASEIKGNQFVIAGGKAGAKVSWQVTGIRHDVYANAHRVKVEVDKGKERGTYLHPELFQKKNPVVAQK